VWRAGDGVCTATLRKHEDYVRCLAYAADAGHFSSAGFDKKVHVWDLESISSASSPGI
jgi:WD repeat-containing protein 48